MLTLNDIDPDYAQFIEPCPTTGCWLWTGRYTEGGYGIWCSYVMSQGPERQRRRRANTVCHRVLYEMAYGPLPEGMETDHICMNKMCINPEHLEAVTHGENVRRRKPMKYALLGGKKPKEKKSRICSEGHHFLKGKRSCDLCAEMDRIEAGADRGVDLWGYAK